MNRRKSTLGVNTMELVMNIASGKYFIVLDDTGGIDFQVITPEGKVLLLKRHLFGPSDIVDPTEVRWRHRLTEPQLKKYEDYFDY